MKQLPSHSNGWTTCSLLDDSSFTYIRNPPGLMSECQCQSVLMLSFRFVHSIIRNLLLPDILMSRVFVFRLSFC